MDRFIELIEQFLPRHHGRDEVWNFVLRDKRKWGRLRVQKYQNTYYISANDAEPMTYPDPRYEETFELRQRLNRWTAELRQWKRELSVDQIGAQAKLFSLMPITMRKGVMQRRTVKHFLPDWMPIERELSADETKDMLALLDRPDPAPQPAMTLALYLEYCRIAYEANGKSLSGFQKDMSGREYYSQYADGRDGGLLKLPEDDPKSFTDWYDGPERLGCHPWEIYRGGNATHIDLGVIKTDAGQWSVFLGAFSSTRLVETCRIALALLRASLPCRLFHRESYRLRLLAEDWVGVVPEGVLLTYAWQDFPREWEVADAIHISWILDEHRQRRRNLRHQLRQIVHWLPENITSALRSRRSGRRD